MYAIGPCWGMEVASMGRAIEPDSNGAKVVKGGSEKEGLKVDSVEVLSRNLDDQRERLQMLDLIGGSSKTEGACPIEVCRGHQVSDDRLSSTELELRYRSATPYCLFST